MFKGEKLEPIILELLEISIEEFTNDTVAMAACKSAIKEGYPLKRNEALKLINKLVTEDTFTTCPHGRPTIITLDRNELDSLFKRT